MTRCAACKQRGGKFRLVGTKWVHVGCAKAVQPRDGTHKNWPLVTTAITGEEMVIQSLPHMRRVEREYGVSSDVYNNDSSNR
jgi:hypothetical protein